MRWWGYRKDNEAVEWAAAYGFCYFTSAGHDIITETARLSVGKFLWFKHEYQGINKGGTCT